VNQTVFRIFCFLLDILHIDAPRCVECLGETRGRRQIRTAAGHTRHADPETRGARPGAWLRHLATDPASIARGAAGAAGLALSRAASVGETRLAGSNLG